MIKTSQISRNYGAFHDTNEFLWSLDIGSTFVWKTRKTVDECVVVGIDTSTGVRIPVAVKTYPCHGYTRVHEVINDD